jgi:hypothetical protein
MTSAGATNPNIHIAAAFSFEERNKEFEEAFQLPNERNSVRIGQYIGPHPRVFPSQWFEIRNEERVPQEPDVEQEVDVVRHAELIAECHQRYGQPARRAFLPELPDQQLSQLMYRHIGGIYNTVGVAPQVGETLLFKPYSLQYREMRQERVRPPGLRESANYHLFTSFKKYQLNRMTENLHSLKNPHEIGKEHAFSDIDAERNILNLPPLLMTQLNKGRQKRWRQIVNAEIPDIFKALESMRFP